MMWRNRKLGRRDRVKKLENSGTVFVVHKMVDSMYFSRAPSSGVKEENIEAKRLQLSLRR